MAEQESDFIKIGTEAVCEVDEQLNVTLTKAKYGAKAFSVSRSMLKKMHCYFRGRTRSGKTSRLIIPIAQQLIQIWRAITTTLVAPYGDNDERQDCVVFIDMGGDISLFRTAKSESEAHGRKFRFFSLDIEHDWCWFDPFQALAASSRTALAVSEYLIAALSVEYGLAYGASYFSMANLSTLLAAAQEMEKTGKPFCLKNAVEAVEKKSKKDGEQIRMMLNVLLQITQLQEVEGRECIDFARAIEDGETIYFWLPSLVGANSARQIAGLALYGVVAAAKERTEQGKADRHTFVFCDEFQEIAGRGFSSLLAQSAKYGVTFLLANQTSDQLKNRDLDLTSIVSDNTGLKVLFTVTTQSDLDALQLFSMDEIATLKSDSTKQADLFGAMSEREYVRPKLQKNVVLEVSAREGFAFGILDDGESFREPTPIWLDYGLTQEVHAEKYTIPTRIFDEIVTKPVAGVHAPYIPEWQRDYSEDEAWQARQQKLAAIWETES